MQRQLIILSTRGHGSTSRHSTSTAAGRLGRCERSGLSTTVLALGVRDSARKIPGSLGIFGVSAKVSGGCCFWCQSACVRDL